MGLSDTPRAELEERIARLGALLLEANARANRLAGAIDELQLILDDDHTLVPDIGAVAQDD